MNEFSGSSNRKSRSSIWRTTIRTLMAITFALALCLALYSQWIIPSQKQQAVFEQLTECVHCSLHRVDTLPWWKRALVPYFGEHYFLDVAEVNLEAGFSFTTDTIKDFKRLQTLSIVGIDPVYEGYHQIFEFSELKEITFERSGLDDLSGFIACKKLRRFGLYELTDASGGAEVFGELEFLKHLHLGDSKINQHEFDGITKSSSIEKLAFSVDLDELDLRNLSRMKQLKEIFIWRSRKTKMDLYAMLDLPNIEKVYVNHVFELDKPVLAKLKARGVVDTW